MKSAPTAVFSTDFLKDVAAGRYRYARLVRGKGNSFGPLGYYGDLLHVNFPKLHLVYRLGEYRADRDVVEAAWPD